MGFALVIPDTHANTTCKNISPKAHKKQNSASVELNADCRLQNVAFEWILCLRILLSRLQKCLASPKFQNSSMGVRRAEVSRSDILLSAYQNAKRKIQHHSRRFSSPLWRISHDTHRILLPCRGRLAFGILQSRIQTLKHVRSCLWAHFQISKPEFCSSLGKENSADQISKSRSRMQMPKSEFRSYLEIWRIQEILKKIGWKIHLEFRFHQEWWIDGSGDEGRCRWKWRGGGERGGT